MKQKLLGFTDTGQDACRKAGHYNDFVQDSFAARQSVSRRQRISQWVFN